MVWSLDEKIKMMVINPSIIHKVNNREYSKITKKEWNEMYPRMKG